MKKENTKPAPAPTRAPPSEPPSEAPELSLVVKDRTEYLDLAAGSAPTITPAEFRFLFILTGFADYKTLGNCFPRISLLATRLDVSTTRVKQYLRSLRKKGWLRVHQTRQNATGYQGPNLYQFCLPPQTEGEPPILGPVDASNHPGLEVVSENMKRA